MKGFRKIFALGVCMLLDLTCVPIPSSASPNPIDFNLPPLWKNPCDLGQDVSTDSVRYKDSDGLTHFQILDKLRNMVQTAINSVTDWEDKWTERNFQKDFDTFYNEMKSTMNPPAYLPNFTEIKKSLGKFIAVDDLLRLDKRKSLQKVFEWLQRVAVGMEQVVYDMYNQNEKYKENFKDAYMQLKKILCEVQKSMTTLKEKDQPSIAKDVKRSDMPQEERNLSSFTFRKIRDWQILVMYLNLMEYIQQMTEHLIVKESPP